MPLFRTEYHDEMDRVYDAVAQPLPRQEAAQLCGKHVIEQPHLVLGDMLPTRNAVDADVPWALMWLELMARLGFLRRNEGWSRLYDRLLDGTDARGVWRPAKGTTPAKGIPLRAANPFTWHMYPLDAGRTVDGGSTDVTFRLGVIARLSGRAVELQ
jgi:hypothetical protein